MNVLRAARTSSPVRRLVVKSSQAVYGAAPGDPSFLTEEVAGLERPAYGLKRDLLEMEQLAQEFSLRTPECSVSVLRLGTASARARRSAGTCRSRSFPPSRGFDPRLQLLHENDAAEAVVRAAMLGHEGVFNVAAAGIVLLSQAIAIMAARHCPYCRRMVDGWADALRAAGVDLPGHLVDMLTYGAVADCARLSPRSDGSPRTTRGRSWTAWLVARTSR